MEKVKVIIAHYNENLDWVKNLKYDYEVISRAGIPKETPPNKGNEASAYLEFIIKNYYNLPDICIFVHGHRSDWHHKQNIDEKIENLYFDKSYQNINDGNAGMMKEIEALNYLRSKQYLLDYINPNVYPEEIKYKCSAQFYVKKEAILNRTVDFYKNLYDWLMNTSEPTYWSGRFFEYTWHIIFTNNPVEND